MPSLTLTLLRSTSILLVLVPVAAGCDELLSDRSCTAVACVSETAVVIHRPNGVWADGDYTLDVRLDGQRHECAFTLPIPGKRPYELQLSGEPFDCTPDLPANFLSPNIALYPAPDRPPCASDAGSQPPLASCLPLDGHYHIEMHTSATPQQIELRLTLAGTVLLEQSEAVQYSRIEPNGPECGPTCYEAHLYYAITSPE